MKQRVIDKIFKEALQRSPYVSADPQIVSGKACVKGTRIPVWCVLNSLLNHGCFEKVATDYRISREQIEGAVIFARRLTIAFELTKRKPR